MSDDSRRPPPLLLSIFDDDDLLLFDERINRSVERNAQIDELPRPSPPTDDDLERLDGIAAERIAIQEALEIRERELQEAREARARELHRQVFGRFSSRLRQRRDNGQLVLPLGEIIIPPGAEMRLQQTAQMTFVAETIFLSVSSLGPIPVDVGAVFVDKILIGNVAQDLAPGRTPIGLFLTPFRMRKTLIGAGLAVQFNFSNLWWSSIRVGGVIAGRVLE